MDSIKVSVVVPILNTKDYIRECLNSIRDQELKEIEVLCIDGGSTDGTLEIIKEYVDLDSRFILVTDIKGSYGAQANRGIDLANGEYIAIAEPDDFVSKAMYSNLYAESIRTHADILRSDYCRFIGDGDKRYFFRKSACNEKWYRNNLSAHNNKELLESTPANWSGIIRKEFLNKYSIRHNTTKGAAYQDLGFWFLTFALANTIRFIPGIGYYYRIDNPSSSINSSNKSDCLTNELIWLKEQLASRGLLDEYEDKYLRVKAIHTEWMRRRTVDIKSTECFDRIMRSEERTCVLFGCGADGVDYLVFLQQQGQLNKILCLTDNDSTIWDTEMLGIPIISPDEVIEKKNKAEIFRDIVFVIGSFRYSEEIKEQLRKRGIMNKDMVCIGN